ncbi:MAG: SpoIIE family protein phosphatase [Conexibacter sp.]|nr:SpoIIE family protein phosphatase [Conexibacter sp.]
MIRNLGDLQALETFFERSEALWAAVLTPDGLVLTASAGLRAAIDGPLERRPFSALVSAPQHPAFDALMARSATQEWASATLALRVGSTGAVADRVVHVRRNDAGLLVIAEPADRQHEQRLVQLIEINDALVATQRELSARQRELEVARDQAERAVRRLQTLEQITIAAMEDDGPDAGMLALLEQACELVGGQRGSLLLLDPDRRFLTMVHRLGSDADELVGWQQPVDDGVAGACARNGSAIIVDDVATDPRVSSLRSPADASLVVVPLRVRGAVVGVLHVGADRRAAFEDEHVVLLAAIGDRAAAVIGHMQNAHRERRIAETFQRSLLPATLPAGALDLVSHYQPQADGSTVGGDWYDAITFPDGRVGLCIGDVAGKGVSAAIIMGQVRSAMHAMALDNRDPGELLQRLDPFVLGLRTMVTLLYVLADPVAETIAYANAGHLPPLRRDRTGHVELLEEALSPPLGVGPCARDAASAHLPRGAQLILYTDGLIERRSEDLRDSLHSLVARCADPRVPPAAMGQHLLDTATRKPGGFDDDVAILTARLPLTDEDPTPRRRRTALGQRSLLR